MDKKRIQIDLDWIFVLLGVTFLVHNFYPEKLELFLFAGITAILSFHTLHYLYTKLKPKN